MWLKWMGGLLLLSAAVLDCLIHTRRLQRTETCVRAWVELLQTVHTRISCLSIPLPDILRGIPPRLWRDLGEDATPREIDLRVLCRASAEHLPSEIGARLLALADEVGRVWRQEQLDRLAAEIRALEQESERLRIGLSPSIRLRGTLSLCGAVALMILMW
ncbi:MAG: hypothetical protein J6R04_03745 [Clostridia bacterium]|nr:hypothetical protein [Clostridia bacterium]